MGFTTVIEEKMDGVLTVTLNRPEALNAMNAEMLKEMHQVVASVRDDQKIKAMVIRGNERAFSAGGDLKFVQEILKNPKEFANYRDQLYGVFFALEELPVPVIAVVRGFALAGGLELAMACDLVVVADDAVLGDQHINVGLIPGGGNTQRLPRKLGIQKALYLMFTGDRLSGKEAVEWGLAFKSVQPEDLDKEVEVLLASLRNRSRPALEAIKKATYQGLQISNLKDAIRHETLSFTEYITTSDHPNQGVQAFMEKRKPQF
jgi:enoyl-CoA hydratase